MNYHNKPIPVSDDIFIDYRKVARAVLIGTFLLVFGCYIWRFLSLASTASERSQAAESAQRQQLHSTGFAN
jgi:hypothetical protein